MRSLHAGWFAMVTPIPASRWCDLAGASRRQGRRLCCWGSRVLHSFRSLVSLSLEQTRDRAASAVSLQRRCQLADANGRKDTYRSAPGSVWVRPELRLGCLLPGGAGGFGEGFSSSWWSRQVSGCSCKAKAALRWELLTFSLIWGRAVAKCSLRLEICRENCSIFPPLNVLSTSGLAAT